MKEYLRPLWIFGLGQAAILLIGVLAFDALDTELTALAASTSGIASAFWGWSWVVTSAKLFYYVFLELGLMFVVAKSFLGIKNG